MKATFVCVLPQLGIYLTQLRPPINQPTNQIDNQTTWALLNLSYQPTTTFTDIR